MTGHRRSPRVAVSLIVVAALGLLGFAVAPAANAAGDDIPYSAGTALIDGDSVSTADGLVNANGQPISAEEYFAEQAGFKTTVVSGATWDSMTTDQFNAYQLLIVGDPDCAATPTSATSNASAWAPAVLRAIFGYTGNRVVLGTDPEAALLHGGGAAQPSGPPGPNMFPTEPIDPLQSGAGRLVSNLMRFAGAMPDATGVYFDTSCADNGADAAALNQLSMTGTGFSTNNTPPCGATVAQPGVLPSPYLAQPDSDLQGWGCSATVSFPTYPPDFQPLAMATDTTTGSTCGVDQTTSTNACGQAYALVAGAGPVASAPDISVTPTSGSDPENFTPGSEPYTVTAHVTQNGAPVAGQPVAFQVDGTGTNLIPRAPGTCAPTNCTTDANGNVSFTYQNHSNPGLTDSVYASTTLGGSIEQATALVNWTGPPLIPVPLDTSDNVQENTPTPVTLQMSPTGGGASGYVVLNPPTHGTLSGSAPDFTYTPDAGYVGLDSFSFVTIGDLAWSDQAVVSIDVTSNPVPIANNASDVAVVNTATPVTLTASDTTGDPLTYTVLTQPTHGTLSGTAPNLTYTPDAGYLGGDALTFEAADGTFVSNPATISINVENPQPTANNAAASTEENTATPITLTGSDATGDALTYSVLTSPAHGTLSGNAPNLTYTPTAGYVGPDSFTFATFDGAAESNPATISITVTGCPKTAPTLDTTVSTDQKSVASKFTSPAITTAGGNELLLAFVESDGPQSAQTITSVTGGGLQWTLAERANATLGTSEVWQAFATAPVSAATVTATLAQKSYDGSITVAAFKGANSTVGAVGTNSATSGGPTVTLTPSTCGSLIWASGHDWTNDTTPVAASGQALVHKDIDTRVGDSYWVQDMTTATQPNATVTMADSGLTSDRWGLAVVEVTPIH